MKKLRKAVKKHKKAALENIGLAVALFFMVMLVAQLYTFEDMPALLSSTLFLQDGAGLILAAVLVIAKLLSLPFLLSMPISPLMKGVGRVLSVLVIVFWILIGVQTMTTSVLDENVGLLGSKVPLMGGVWLVSMMCGFLLMLVWHISRVSRANRSS